MPPPGYPPPGYTVPPPGYTYPPPGYAYPPPPGYAPPPVSPSGHRLAEFGDRLGAYLIDGLILGGITLVLFLPVYIWFFSRFWDFSQVYELNPTAPPPDPFKFMLPFILLALGAFAVSLVARYLYEVEAMFRSGQTIGKRVTKIKVVPIDPHATLDRTMALKRFLVQFVAAAVVPGLSWVDGLWQLWDKPYRQCLHDKFANTVVIKINT